MADSITLGSYVISTDESASTTDGVSLLPLDEAQPTISLFIPRVTSDLSEIAFYVHVTAASTSALKTAVDTVTSAVTQNTGDATVKYGSDAVYEILLAAGGYESSQGETTVDYGELDAVIYCVVRYLRFQPSSGAGSAGGVENPDGLVGTVQWAVGRSSVGKLRVVASCIVRDTESTTARENALAWVRNFYSTQSLPSWLPGSDRLRRVDDTVTVEEADTDVTVAGTAVAAVTLEDVGAGMASLNALVNRATVAVNVASTPIDVKAGLAPQIITINGSFEIKTAGSSAWDSGDSEPTITLAILRTAVDVIYDAALARLGLTRGQVRQVTGDLSTSEEGSASFVISGVSAESAYIEWQESLVANATSNVTYTGNYGGGETEHLSGAEGVATVQHTLRVVAVGGGASYQTPQEVAGPNWRMISASDSAPVTRAARSYVGEVGADVRVTEATFSRLYRFKNSQGGRTSAGGLAGLIQQVFGG